MGANDALEMLEAAKADNILLERANGTLSGMVVEQERIINAIAALHIPKAGIDNHDRHYLICDYDKTGWPCKTYRILHGAAEVRRS